MPLENSFKQSQRFQCACASARARTPPHTHIKAAFGSSAT